MTAELNRRRGIAMVLVLVVLAVATIVGMAYLQSSTIRRLGSLNLPVAARAKYLAESGLAHAMYQLQADLPAMVSSSRSSPLGPFFADETSANYRFYAEPVPEALGTYIVTAEGVSGAVKQKCSVMVRVAAAPEVTIPYALMVDSSGGSQNEVTTPASLTISGDIYAGDGIINYSNVTGNVWSSGSISDPLLRIQGTQHEHVPPRTRPTICGADYAQYKLFTTTYHWQVAEKPGDLTKGHPLANGGAITSTNPAGVVHLIPASADDPIKLKADFHFQGTLIIDGSLLVDGPNIQLTPVDGFPAVIATGRIIAKHDRSITINGLVIADGGIVFDNDSAKPLTAINGGLLCRTIGYHSSLKGTHTLTYVPQRCRIYDFSNDAKLPKLEVLRWDD